MLSRKEVIQMLDDGIPDELRSTIGTLEGLVHEGKHLVLKEGTRCILYLCRDASVWMYWYRQGMDAGRFCVSWELAV